MDRRRLPTPIWAIWSIGFALGACQPSVQLKAPDKPIVINLNVKIEREVRIKIEREIEDLLRDRKDLF